MYQGYLIQASSNEASGKEEVISTFKDRLSAKVSGPASEMHAPLTAPVNPEVVVSAFEPQEASEVSAANAAESKECSREASQRSEIQLKA